MNCPSCGAENPEEAETCAECSAELLVSTEEGTEATEQTTEVKKKKSASTPFDLPFVFPALLFILGLWFGYDGWFNDEIKSKTFNKIVACVFGATFVWTMWVDITDVKRSRAKKLKQQEEATAASES